MASSKNQRSVPMGQAASGLITSATAVICHAWTNRLWFKNFMKHLGFVWKCTTRGMNPIKVRLLADELPMKGRLVVSLTGHYTAVIDGVIHDTYNPTQAVLHTEGGVRRMTHRGLDGYWIFEGK